VLRIADGDFTARGEVSKRADEIDAIVVGLNMLAESFERERVARDRAEALLADALDSYENAPGLFCSIDAASFRIVKTNQTFADVIGCSKEALQGQALIDLCAPSSRAELDRRFLDFAVANNSGPAGGPAEYEYGIVAVTADRCSR